MNQFEHIRISNFRRLVDVNVSLNPLTVVVGEGGVGKTSFLDAWLLLKGASEGELSQRVNDWGGIKSLLTGRSPQNEIDDDEVNDLSCQLSMSLSDEEPLTYQLSLSQQDNSYWIPGEKLKQRDGRIFLDFLEPLHLMQSPIVRATNPEAKLAHLQASEESPILFRDRLKTLQYYSPLNISATSAILQSQSEKMVTAPGLYGEELISCLHTYRDHYPALYAEIEERLREVFPDFEGFDFPTVSIGKLSLNWRDHHYSQSFSINQLPASQLRFVWLMTILLQPNPPGLILIDEPELGLHPKMLRPLAKLLQNISHFTQLIVTTQSDRLVRCLNPEDVIVAERDAGATRFIRGEEIDLSRWLVACATGITQSSLSKEIVAI